MSDDRPNLPIIVVHCKQCTVKTAQNSGNQRLPSAEIESKLHRELTIKPLR